MSVFQVQVKVAYAPTRVTVSGQLSQVRRARVKDVLEAPMRGLSEADLSRQRVFRHWYTRQEGDADRPLAFIARPLVGAQRSQGLDVLRLSATVGGGVATCVALLSSAQGVSMNALLEEIEARAKQTLVYANLCTLNASKRLTLEEMMSFPSQWTGNFERMGINWWPATLTARRTRPSVYTVVEHIPSSPWEQIGRHMREALAAEHPIVHYARAINSPPNSSRIADLLFREARRVLESDPDPVRKARHLSLSERLFRMSTSRWDLAGARVVRPDVLSTDEQALHERAREIDRLLEFPLVSDLWGVGDQAQQDWIAAASQILDQVPPEYFGNQQIVRARLTRLGLWYRFAEQLRDVWHWHQNQSDPTSPSVRMQCLAMELISDRMRQLCRPSHHELRIFEDEYLPPRTPESEASAPRSKASLLSQLYPVPWNQYLFHLCQTEEALAAGQRLTGRQPQCGAVLLGLHLLRCMDRLINELQEGRPGDVQSILAAHQAVRDHHEAYNGNIRYSTLVRRPMSALFRRMNSVLGSLESDDLMRLADDGRDGMVSRVGVCLLRFDASSCQREPDAQICKSYSTTS